MTYACELLQAALAEIVDVARDPATLTPHRQLNELCTDGYYGLARWLYHASAREVACPIIRCLP